MHGLIFVTWEKFLTESFGAPFLDTYRTAIGETPLNAPLAHRVYTDEQLLAGVNAACQLSSWPAEKLLRRYGRYFISNGLTSHLCSYLLTQVHGPRDLLLMMRKAHAQMRCTPDGLTPPLFGYQALPNDPDGLLLIYNSARQLCPLLLGAIEGAATRFGGEATIIEHMCMKRGDAECRFEIHFSGPPAQPVETPEQHQLRESKQQLADTVLQSLPPANIGGVTLLDLHRQLQPRLGKLRLNILYEALYHLQYAGLIASTANQRSDDLAHRLYWRAPVVQGEP